MACVYHNNVMFLLVGNGTILISWFFWTCIHNTIVVWTCNMIIPLFCINGCYGTMICGHVPWQYYVFRDMIIIPLFTCIFFFFGARTIMMPFYSLNFLGVPWYMKIPWYMKMAVMFSDVSIWSDTLSQYLRITHSDF